MEISRALVDKEVDAIAIWEPAAQDAVDRLGDDAIEFRTKGLYREIFNLHTTAEKLADPVKRKQIVDFSRKIIECSKQLRENPEPVFPLMAKVSGYDIDLLRRAWPHHNFTPSMPKDLLDVLVEEDVWVATETGRKPRSREQLATTHRRQRMEGNQQRISDHAARLADPSRNNAQRDRLRKRPALGEAGRFFLELV